ncbi:NAD-dependent epimerase/dehydratase family protein [Auraticoccus sp. F435]|uniref:NAD-dependent epimerase/dehydratase family protein n=1 Tax=Auraticoccus cholistanensis TaxID=2656650 RepID=A0A6A9UYS6_9ACTN|nr:NAD-dependent epimerase/dehydratase family protein [Auraticoccus cholistanensis]MVA77014.1 NAD-dependent epimerase/dehydratase family protein [Auraticoccus cholistanensis]
MSRVVLVTGVSDDFAARCARALASLPATTVIGVDLVPPRRPLDAVTFVRADIRSPVMTGLITGRGVDTVVHLPRRGPGRSRAAAKELAVLGSMQLLAACQRAPGFRSLVLPSSGEVYGSSPRDPAVFAEDRGHDGGPRSPFAQDCLEVESYARALGQRRDDVTVTILRMAPLMGAGVRSDLTRYLTAPVVPTVAGFDARLQFLHPADGARAVTTAVERCRPGIYNVGAPDVVVLSQLLAWLGRPSVPVPRAVARALRRTRSRTGLVVPEDLDGVTWGRVMDVRRIADELGFQTHWSSRQAAEEFVALASPGVLRRVLDGRGAEEGNEDG